MPLPALVVLEGPRCCLDGSLPVRVVLEGRGVVLMERYPPWSSSRGHVLSSWAVTRPGRPRGAMCCLHGSLPALVVLGGRGPRCCLDGSLPARVVFEGRGVVLMGRYPPWLSSRCRDVVLMGVRVVLEGRGVVLMDRYLPWSSCVVFMGRYPPWSSSGGGGPRCCLDGSLPARVVFEG